MSFRLVNDKDTGRSKGYGFCEFESHEIAQLALRNLSTVAFNGRPLRIGPANAGDLSAFKVPVSGSQNNFGQFQQPSSGPLGGGIRGADAMSSVTRAANNFGRQQGIF